MAFSPLSVEWDGEHWVLTKPLVYGDIVVPAGFPTDKDSVPRVPFAYWLFKGRSRRPPVVHDYLYASQAGRAYADRVFLDAMKDRGMPARLRYPIYWAVRTFGWWAYRKHKGGPWDRTK